MRTQIRTKYGHAHKPTHVSTNMSLGVCQEVRVFAKKIIFVTLQLCVSYYLRNSLSLPPPPCLSRTQCVRAYTYTYARVLSLSLSVSISPSHTHTYKSIIFAALGIVLCPQFLRSAYIVLSLIYMSFYTVSISSRTAFLSYCPIIFLVLGIRPNPLPLIPQRNAVRSHVRKITEMQFESC